MSKSRQSGFSRITEDMMGGVEVRPKLDMDGLMRDTVAMERIAGALESIADALFMDAKLNQQRFDIEHPPKPDRNPVTVSVAKYRTPRDEENNPIELEDEIEIDKATGKAKVKPGVTFYEEPKARGAAASRRRS